MNVLKGTMRKGGEKTLPNSQYYRPVLKDVGINPCCCHYKSLQVCSTVDKNPIANSHPIKLDKYQKISCVNIGELLPLATVFGMINISLS
ncbi:hypothetical protein LIPSTDRAFT_275695 [Lipomyces starkeyi NRRL Y-11557]|uniref:Uncharacterized protein n=1 Tax=Lipomyces starkeyi NRRL Y-11557 TaxID=675824 RepID=A0A1E3Q8H9_LIPST|nr:hypothetical protein LIPSTDRAFT_275695 [Lipomyces starkeyi NRRL Y-11557]